MCERCHLRPRQASPLLSSSSPSSSSTPTHSLRAQSRDSEASNYGDTDPTPLMNRTDNDAKPASPDMVYFWKWSGVNADVARPEVADKLQAAYGAQGQVIQHMSVFRERHQQSQSTLEQNWHFHAVVQTTHLCRWRLLARHLRENFFFPLAPLYYISSTVGRSCWARRKG